MRGSYSLKGVYAISDDRLGYSESTIAGYERAIQSGVSLFQLRDKTRRDHELLPVVCRLYEACSAHGVLFVLNDRVSLALRLELEGMKIGLHVGKTDMVGHSAQSIRRDFKGILGGSAYNDIASAKELQLLGFDYVAFGSMFPSTTKPGAVMCDIHILDEAKSSLDIPVCAIGGIDASNVGMLCCADMVASISYIWSGDVGLNVYRLAESFEACKTGRG